MKLYYTTYVLYFLQSGTAPNSRSKKPVIGGRNPAYQARIAPAKALGFSYFDIVTIEFKDYDESTVKCVSGAVRESPRYFIDGLRVELGDETQYPAHLAHDLAGMRRHGYDTVVVTRHGKIVVMSENDQVVSSEQPDRQ